MDSGEKLVAGVGAAFLAIGSIFLLVTLGTLIGALAGWIVGLFFGDTILGILNQLGVKGISMWQFGAFMGFTGGFLKTKVTAEVKPAKVK
jgi:hypothetical protein